MKFWIYLDKELVELKPDFEKLFGVENLYHDYENVWEWIESADRNSEIYLNISRTHDGISGDYDKPIMIKIEAHDALQLNEWEIAMKVKEHINCEVFAGEIHADQDDNPVILEERRY